MKKVILLPLISLMVLQVVAQTKTVNIHGFVRDTTVKSVELIHPADAKLLKWENTKVDVVNGAFNTLIQVPFPAEISIAYGNRVFSNYFIYSDAEILIDSAGKPHMTGSPMQDEYDNKFLTFFQSNDQVRDSLRAWYNSYYQKYGQDLPQSIKDSVNLLSERYYAQKAKLLEEYIKLHPDSYIALWHINYLIAMTPAKQYVDFGKLFSSFSNGMQQHSFINVLKEKIVGTARMQAGQLFPNEFFKGHEQMQSKISKKSKYYLIDFWYSRCVPCAKEFPKLKEIYNQFNPKGFNIVSISVDKQTDRKEYTAAIKKYQLSWNHVWDHDGLKADKFNIHFFPTYILLDKDGRIINPDIRTNELEAFLNKNL